MNQITILWSFSSIEASISEIFAIKNYYFLALILIHRAVGKIVGKNSLWLEVGQVKKAGNSKQSFSSRLSAEIMVVCAVINLERTSHFSLKVASCGYNLIILLFLITGPREGLHSRKLNSENWIIRKDRKLHIRVCFVRFSQIQLQQLFTGKESLVLKSLPAVVVLSYFTASERKFWVQKENKTM